MEKNLVKTLKVAIAVVAESVVELCSEVGRLERENAELKRRVEALEAWRLEQPILGVAVAAVAEHCDGVGIEDLEAV